MSHFGAKMFATGRPTRAVPKEKGTAIMKLTTVTQVSVDGVMQVNGPSEEEHKAGFERDGWAIGHFGSESRTFVDQVYQRADALNTKPKYVASNTLTEPRWADTTILPGDLTAAIGELNLLICPVVVGQGTRLFPGTGPDMALDLVESRAFPKGITLQVYRPAGRPQYATR
jgi:hypothetical protein